MFVRIGSKFLGACILYKVLCKHAQMFFTQRFLAFFLILLLALQTHADESFFLRAFKTVFVMQDKTTIATEVVSIFFSTHAQRINFVKKQEAMATQVISKLMERQEIPQNAEEIRQMRDEDVFFSRFLFFFSFFSIFSGIITFFVAYWYCDESIFGDSSELEI